jgi:formylglycine-generating enzyme required for sulfatase activity
VGTLRANLFGIHDMHGNVWEWCEDGFAPYADDEVRPSDGLRIVPGAVERVHWGGTYKRMSRAARSASRGQNPPGARLEDLGVHPMWPIDR